MMPVLYTIVLTHKLPQHFNEHCLYNIGIEDLLISNENMCFIFKLRQKKKHPFKRLCR